MIDRLNAVNTFPILPVTHPDFGRYGKLVTGYDFSELIACCAAQSPMPEAGNTYVASVPQLESLAIAGQVSNRFYGDMPLQIGYCNGYNSKLNAFEYHKGSELDIAVTPLVLLLAPLQSIHNNSMPTAEAQAFYLPAGTAVELYATTLHFSPCRVADTGFKCLIVLPRGTNQPLPSLPKAQNDEDTLLWMQNKWLIAHADSIPASKGACVGLTGQNLEVLY